MEHTTQRTVTITFIFTEDEAYDLYKFLGMQPSPRGMTTTIGKFFSNLSTALHETGRL